MVNDLLAKHAKKKELNGGILTIASEIQKVKVKNPDVINAVIGMFFNEDGRLFKFEVVDEILKGLTVEERFFYTETNGGKSFKEAVLKWVLKDDLEFMQKQLYMDVMATPGGTGAVSNTIFNYLNPGEKVLVPNIYWKPYKTTAEDYKIDLEMYDMFLDNKFNLENFKQKVNKLAEEQKRVLVVINDPCHNPTGYILSSEEWNEIINIINSVTQRGIPAIILHDIAYFDFHPLGLDESRKVFMKYTSLHENGLIVTCFSGSKSFSLYGLRIGAQIAFSKNENIVKSFNKANEFSSRGRWSNTPRPGISLLINLMNDQGKLKRYIEEIKLASSILNERAKLFIEEAKKVNLPIYPYKGGFFVTVKTENPNVIENLKKEKVFVIPLEKGVRIALCSVSKKDIKRLIISLNNHIYR